MAISVSIFFATFFIARNACIPYGSETMPINWFNSGPNTFCLSASSSSGQFFQVIDSAILTSVLSNFVTTESYFAVLIRKKNHSTCKCVKNMFTTNSDPLHTQKHDKKKNVGELFILL